MASGTSSGMFCGASWQMKQSGSVLQSFPKLSLLDMVYLLEVDRILSLKRKMAQMSFFFLHF